MEQILYWVAVFWGVTMLVALVVQAALHWGAGKQRRRKLDPRDPSW